jgi:hypothetical protein
MFDLAFVTRLSDGDSCACAKGPAYLAGLV